MAISVSTSYGAVSDEGTNYGDSITETMDQDTDAVFPIRYQFVVGTTKEQVLAFSVADAFATELEGADGWIQVINRDDTNSATIYLNSTSNDEGILTIGPGEWVTMPSLQIDINAGGFNNLAFVYAAFANASGKLEILVFNNPGS